MTHVVRVCVAVAALAIVLAAYRDIAGRSSRAAAIVGAGILLRSFLGVILFWISYVGAPVATGLQAGGGFWIVTADAKSYFGYAAAAADSSIVGMYAGDSSPFYVRTLAVWMWLVGISPAAGLFLNLCLYVIVCVVLVRTFRPNRTDADDLPCLIALFGFSFSPVVLIHATQAMKEDLFALLIVLMCLCMYRILPTLIYNRRSRPFTLSVAAVSIYALNFAIAGIRPYYAVIIFGVTALVLAIGFAVGFKSWPSYLGRAVIVLTILWSAYWIGAGPSYWGPTLDEMPSPARAVAALQRVRTGFILTGGNTNMVAAEAVSHQAAQNEASSLKDLTTIPDDADRKSDNKADPHPRRLDPHDAGHQTLGTAAVMLSYGKALATGLSAIVVPITVLKALSVVSFPGGRGLLYIADVDTLFMDLTVLGMLICLYRFRHRLTEQVPFVTFCLGLSVLSACLLAYVVTNFGSLFRIKSMVAIPIWTLAVALGHGGFTSNRTSRPD